MNLMLEAITTDCYLENKLVGNGATTYKLQAIVERTSLLIFIGITAVFVIVFLMFFGILPGLKPSTPKPATIEFWGINDDEEVWRDVIARFKEKNPSITVIYRRLNEETYEENLINRLAEGKGPDIFLLKNTWILKHKDKIAQLPQAALNFQPKDFRSLFVDVAADNLINARNAIVGLPLWINTPALFYNKDIFNTEGFALPPKTWDELILISKKLTKITAATGDIQQSGIALGSYGNIEHAFEIISSLLLEKGERIVAQTAEDTFRVILGKQAEEALDFYTSFTNQQSPNYSWTPRMENSLDAFAEEKTAMAIGFVDDIKRINAKNPHLNFAIAPFPQFDTRSPPQTFASYYFPAVSKLSQNQDAAWKFLYFVTTDEGSGIYLQKTDRVTARRDVISLGTPSGTFEVFYKQALQAKSWPVPDENRTKKLLGDAVGSLVSRSKTPGEALATFKEQLELLLP